MRQSVFIYDNNLNRYLLMINHRLLMMNCPDSRDNIMFYKLFSAKLGNI